MIARLNSYFHAYFCTFSAPTAETLFLLVLSILVMESAVSIRFLYRHFLAGITEKSLNAFYYACSYAKADYSRFMNVTVRMALTLIPEHLREQPVFLCIDDTIVPKFGKHFEEVSTLFDHAAHNGSSYLNGHCFVSLMLRIPVWRKNQIHYLALPLGYRMWTKEESKLKLAASMVRQVMPDLTRQRMVILLCDSWYVKKDVLCLVEEYQNLDLIGNARSDSVLYDLPPQPTGKRGRPAVHGRRLSIQDDFTLSKEKIGDYYLAVRSVLTNLFGMRVVLAYVTASEKTSGSRRLFFSTIRPEGLGMFCAWQETSPINQMNHQIFPFLPVLLYAFRWKIEVSYYEQKTFWSLCHYRIRSKKGIEGFVNLINLAYCTMKLLPYQDREWETYQSKSVQEFRFALSEQIRQQLFYASFVKKLETQIKSTFLVNFLKRLILQQGYHL